jgi:acyl carrier protein
LGSLWAGTALLTVSATAVPEQTSSQPKPSKTSQKDRIAEKVKQIIVEQLGVDAEKVTPTARLVEDLGADSLDKVELTMALEEAFDIEIPDADSIKLHTVKNVVDYIKLNTRPQK